MTLMGNAPHDFVFNHSAKDLKRLTAFKHRTFNTTDLLYFVHFFNQYYQKEKSLEAAFLTSPPAPLSNIAPPKRFAKARGRGGDPSMKTYLINFHNTFFSLDDSPPRTRKHIATPDRKSACKRINMFLRWMVRSDDRGVDFGLWKNISPAQLICPIDLHVERIARKLKLIKRKQVDWQTAEELTANLKKLDPTDPVKYDFALFGLGIDRF
jgi:uncharacterized protein (TIGR02757 family)